MKLFGLLLFTVASVSAADTPVTEFCGADLHAKYGTDDSLITYVKQAKKPSKDGKPKKQAMKKVVVRPECADNARRNGNKPGGYPDLKEIPVVKCTKKGPNGSNKLKPNGKRFGKSKLVHFQTNFCTPDG